MQLEFIYRTVVVVLCFAKIRCGVLGTRLPTAHGVCFVDLWRALQGLGARLDGSGDVPGLRNVKSQGGMHSINLNDGCESGCVGTTLRSPSSAFMTRCARRSTVKIRDSASPRVSG